MTTHIEAYARFQDAEASVSAIRAENRRIVAEMWRRAPWDWGHEPQAFAELDEACARACREVEEAHAVLDRMGLA